MTDIEKEVSNFISADKDNPVPVQLDADITPEDAERLRRMMQESSLQILPIRAENTVTIPVTAYAELIRSQTQLDFLRSAYIHEKYSIDSELICVFGPKPKEEHDA